MRRISVILLVLLFLVVLLGQRSSADKASALQIGGDLYSPPIVIDVVDGQILVVELTPEPTGTAVLPTVTATPQPTSTETAVPTETPTAGPTSTPSPTVVPTSTHDVTSWHAPGDFHHHGASVIGTEFEFIWLQYAGQTIAYPWVSSPIENLYPISAGKHEGFTGLYEADTGCEMQGLSGNCIRSYYLMVHSLGNLPAILTRIHSFGLAAEICAGDDGSGECGFIFTGGHHDYGMLHRGYKQAYCGLDDDPGLPLDLIDQPPYRTGHQLDSFPLRDENVQFWSSLINPITNEFYPHGPNHMAEIAWSSSDAWDYMVDDPALCSDAVNAVQICPDGSCEFNHTLFQVFTIRLENLPTERPFSGFTDVNGHIDPSCTAVSEVCVPLFISETVPQGLALLNRNVRHAECAITPCLEFDDGTLLHAPGYGE